MQGQDKGLLHHRGRPLAAWVLGSLATSNDACLSAIGITANRHADAYRALLADSRPVQHGGTPLAVPGGVLPDAPDLPERSGPMAGILTALRHSRSEWVLVLPCDTPHLPESLLPRLLEGALSAQADIAVPRTTGEAAPPGTHDTDGTRHHWVCALIRTHLIADLERAFVNGDRKVGQWIQSQAWVGVSFTTASDFQNVNTTEALHGRD